jgi:hypothetical protein
MSDQLEHYRVSRQIYAKRFFNPNDPVDLQLAYEFIQTGKWKDRCPFVESWPYTNVPDMIKTEVLLKYLPKIIKEQRALKKKKTV